MRSARERLKQALVIRIGLPDGTPTDDQLDLIVGEVARMRRPTLADWRSAARRHVPLDGPIRLIEGEDMSDLNLLLFQIINQGAQGGGR